MLLELPTFSNTEELMAALRGTEISVPRRTEGRKTHHTERWVMCHLMATLAEVNMLQYPLSLNHRDRPDFLLECNGLKIGIEATEAISEQYAAYAALAEREFPKAFLEPAHFKSGMPTLTVKEMRAILQTGSLTAEPWVGDQPERDWASYVASVVEVKLKKLAKPEFNRFSENWLSIYDNLPMPHIELADAVEFLVPMMQPHWTNDPAFNAVFIEHGQVVAKISEAEVKYLPLKNVW